MMWRSSRRLLAFGLLSAAVVASIAYSRGMRSVAIPERLQWVPKESSILIACGDIASLWRAVEGQFGSAIRDRAHKGMLSSAVESLDGLFRDSDVPIASLSDLANRGVDVSQGMALAVDRNDLLLQVGIGDAKRFTEFVGKLLDREPAQEPVWLTGTPGDGVPVTRLGEEADAWFVAFPQRDLALVSNSHDFLARGLLQRAANLAHARGDDALFHAVRRGLRRPLFRGAEVFAFFRRDALRSAATGISMPIAAALDHAAGVIRFANEGIRIEASAWVNTGGIRALDDLLTPHAPEPTWQRRIPAEVAAVLASQHPALFEYLPLIKPPEGTLGVVFRALRDSESSFQLVVAVNRYRAGLPDLTLGIRTNGEPAQRLVADLQRRLREERDRKILQRAVDAFCQTRTRPAPCAPSLADLAGGGLLLQEPHPLFERFGVTGGRVGSAQFRDDDFHASEYVRQAGERTIRFLAPRLSGNDRLYNPQLKNQSDDSLSSDRYRLASIFSGDMLWIATDADDLPGGPGAGGGEAGSLSESGPFQSASQRWGPGDLAEGFLNIERVIALGLLSERSELESMVRYGLLDLRNHTSVSWALTAGGDRKSLRLVAVIAR